MLETIVKTSAIACVGPERNYAADERGGCINSTRYCSNNGGNGAEEGS